MSGGNTNQSAHRVSTSKGKVGVYDIVGIDSEHCDWFIRHVGMSLDEMMFTKGNPLSVRIVDMGPPLASLDSAKPTSVDVVGTADLSADDVSAIYAFICEQLNEYQSLQVKKRAQYYVYPHFVKGDGKTSANRYSCAGFVYECYLNIGITLVDLASVPTVTAEPLKLAFPDQRRNLDRPERREMAGLSGEGPWPVLLPGYLFHSLGRGSDQIRQAAYQPKPGDECFPRRETEQPATAES